MVKKILQLAGISFLLVFGIGGFLTSCQNPATPGVENDDNNQQNGEETVKSSSVLSFGMDSLAGLAITSAGSPYKSVARAVGGYSESLLKIKESGDIEKFISFPEGTRVELSNVSYVVQSPVEGSKDFYIVFGSDSYWYEIYTETDEWGGSWQNEKQHVIGQLLYVTEDGAYYDILKNDDSIGSNLCCSSSWNGGYEDRDYSTTLQFDSEGNLYYLVSEYEKTGSSKDMIYKFDPKTKKSTNLVAAISNTSYSEFYVSSAGDWVFVQGSRSSTSNSYFLRAIPTDNPTKTVDIYYSNSSYVEDWIYDEESRNVYYLQGNALYRSSYVGGTYTEDSQVIAAAADSYKESFSYESLLDHNWRYKYNYRINGKANAKKIGAYDQNKDYFFINPVTGDYDYEEMVNYCFADLLNYVKEKYTTVMNEGTYETGEIYEYETSVWKDYRAQYEIRFDEFSNIPGFEDLALKTKNSNGKSLADAELFEAIIENDLVTLLYDAIHHTRYLISNVYNNYDYNFYADVLYDKETGDKIQKSVFNFDVTGFEDRYSFDLIISDSADGAYYYEWDSNLLSNGVVDATKVLNKLADFCGVEAIDFSLKSFQDDADYAALYTDKTNEDAIKFLSSNEKLEVLYNCINSGSEFFLSRTCFIPGTNKPAYKEEIEWSYLSELVLAGKALYCIEKNWDSTSKLVQLTDNDGNAVCEYVDFGEQQLLQFSSFEVYDNCFYFKNEILKASGEQSGKQTILRFDPVTATLEEMLYYMSNNTDYEIVSYDVSGSYLYCCFVNGTEIFIGRINVSDKSYKKFTANTDTELRKIMMLE